MFGKTFPTLITAHDCDMLRAEVAKVQPNLPEPTNIVVENACCVKYENVNGVDVGAYCVDYIVGYKAFLPKPLVEFYADIKTNPIPLIVEEDVYNPPAIANVRTTYSVIDVLSSEDQYLKSLPSKHRYDLCKDAKRFNHLRPVFTVEDVNMCYGDILVTIDKLAESHSIDRKNLSHYQYLVYAKLFPDTFFVLACRDQHTQDLIAYQICVRLDNRVCSLSLVRNIPFVNKAVNLWTLRFLREQGLRYFDFANVQTHLPIFSFKRAFFNSEISTRYTANDAFLQMLADNPSYFPWLSL